ncbi:MAG: MBL fold metallo-hydrolase [Candidatus Hermodarchaeota archaeon]
MFKYNLKIEANEIDGVYQFKINFPSFEGLQFVCMYLLRLDGSYILIDAGLSFRECEDLFFSKLEKLNISINDLKYLILTHEHPDHIGIAKAIKCKNPNIEILTHEMTNSLMRWMARPKNLEIAQNSVEESSSHLMKYGVGEKHGRKVLNFMTNFRRLTEYQKPDRLLHDNDEILINSTKLRIIWTPGHSIGHICVFDEEKRYLFSGDHILSRITPHIGAYIIPNVMLEEYQGFDFNNVLNYYLNSLDRIDQLNPRIIFPAHQEIIYNPHERILDIKKHHENRLIEIAKAIEKEPKTPFEISQIHFGKNLSEINVFLALHEVLSHLIYLEYQNKVKRIEKGNKILFIKKS